MSRGRPFEMEDIWRLSSFELEETTGSLIQAKLSDSRELEFDNQEGLCLPELKLPEIGDIASPPGGDLNDQEVSQFSPLALPSLSAPSTDGGDQDIWSLDFELDNAQQLQQLYTWEAFENKEDATATRTAYLSEAGPEAFNAALQQSTDASATVDVLPQHITLRALRNVVLGRSSNLFQWDAEKGAFIRTLPDVPICGMSPATSSSVIAGMSAAGSTYRVLGSFASSPNKLSNSCTALVAFKGCVLDILDGLEAKLLFQTRNCRSILQLQRAMDRPHQLLALLSALTETVKDCDSDEGMISSISDFVHQHTAAGNRFTTVLKSVLTRTSGPWLERLCHDVGLGGEFLSPDMGSAAPVVEIDDHSAASLAPERRRVDMMPSFVTEDDRALIASTKESVQAVRRHLPDHASGSGQRLNVDYSSREGLHYFKRPLSLQAEKDMWTTTKPEETMAWADEDRQGKWLSTIDARMSQPLESNLHPPTKLRSALDKSLDYAEQDELDLMCEMLPFDPLQKLRPAMAAHNRLLNKTLLRHIFDDLDLRQHLELQRQYHLLGNGDFVARLSQALFSADTQTAERRRDVVPNSKAMGLRLDTREGQSWPPASSELRLTLAGVLAETYFIDGARRGRRTKEDLPGGLSFSVRELPEEEIDRVMDVDSIYALDFLRLRYDPPPCLDVILTPAALKAYDDIFKFLIRLLRVQHVATKLRERFVFNAVSRQSRGSASHNSHMQFALEAHTALSVLFTHFVDVGIESPWRAFVSSIVRVEHSLETEDGSVDGQHSGLNEIRATHDTYLERVRSRLFLRRKGEKLRKAVDEVLIRVLAGALEVENSGDGAFDIAPFKTTLVDLRGALESTVERPHRAAFTEADESDTEAMKILLMRLR